MNCHQKSEPHVWRYSKHNKFRRCVKCKSKLPITKEEFNLKWGMKKSIEKSTDSENRASEQEEMREEQHELDLKENYEADEKYEESKD
jgi:hypothetical protein